MADNDKKDVLKDVQEFIKANPNNGDVDILIQAMEKAIQDNYILDRDAIEVLDFVDRYKGGICVSEPYKGYEPKYEFEMSIWDRGSKCFALVSDAVHKLKKKYVCKMQPQHGSIDAAYKMQPQRKREKSFIDYIVVEDKENYLSKLHDLINNKVGRRVAMVIKAAIETKGLMARPTSTMVEKEFGNIGSKSGYNKYMNYDFSRDSDYRTITEILEMYVD